MGVYRLQKFLDQDVPNEYCWQVNVKELADEYRNETGREPVVIVDGPICVKRIYDYKGHEWMLGGQVMEFVEDMKNFVAAFEVMYVLRSQSQARETLAPTTKSGRCGLYSGL
jgi:hypothetical protein